MANTSREDKAKRFFEKWGIDTSRDEKWGGYGRHDPKSFEGRHSFYEDDSDIFLDKKYIPKGQDSSKDKGQYLGRATKGIDWYRGKGKVEEAIKEIGIKNWDTENDIGQVLAYMYKKEMDEGRDGDDGGGTETPQELIDAREKWDEFEKRRGEGSIDYDPTSGKSGPGIVGGVGAAADYGNRATEDFQTRFIPHLYATANLQAQEMGYAGSQALANFRGAVPDLDSSGIRDIYGFYSDQITDFGKDEGKDKDKDDDKNKGKSSSGGGLFGSLFG